jgi:hypothetical protein
MEIAGRMLAHPVGQKDVRLGCSLHGGGPEEKAGTIFGREKRFGKKSGLHRGERAAMNGPRYRIEIDLSFPCKLLALTL